jgi:hypothetical protein
VPAFPAGISNQALSRAILQRCHFDFGTQGKIKIPRTFAFAPWKPRADDGFFFLLERGKGSAMLFDEIAAKLDLNTIHLHLVAGMLVVTIGRRDGLSGERVAHYEYSLSRGEFSCPGPKGTMGKDPDLFLVQEAIACEFAIKCSSSRGTPLSCAGSVGFKDLAAKWGTVKKKTEQESKGEKREREDDAAAQKDPEEKEPPTKKLRESPPEAEPRLARPIANKILSKIKLSPLQLQLLSINTLSKLSSKQRAELLYKNGAFADEIEAAAKEAKIEGAIPTMKQLYLAFDH